MVICRAWHFQKCHFGHFPTYRWSFAVREWHSFLNEKCHWGHFCSEKMTKKIDCHSRFLQLFFKIKMSFFCVWFLEFPPVKVTIGRDSRCLPEPLWLRVGLVWPGGGRPVSLENDYVGGRRAWVPLERVFKLKNVNWIIFAVENDIFWTFLKNHYGCFYDEKMIFLNLFQKKTF